MPRFVILKHDTPDGYPRPTHWDLMLEVDGALATWALAEEPQAGRTTTAEKLADHRLAYLDYEGPLSGERGTVTRCDAGEYELLAQVATTWHVHLSGQKLRGELTLRAAGDKWQAQF